MTSENPWPLRGFLSLLKAEHLRKKLRHDHLRLEASSPKRIEFEYAALDFAVTAHHLLDWWMRDGSLPGEQAEEAKRRMRKGAWQLRMIDDIVNRGKHYERTRGDRTAQAEMHGGAFSAAFSREFNIGSPRVRPLAADLAAQGHQPEPFLPFATKVLEFWEAQDLSAPPDAATIARLSAP